ncbi:hypothetical protein PbJCM13498_10520 [Prolixibacter bellariivorans]|uniref:Type I restriction enzyme R protein N-terminal domain-containing protein n=1 Tax=Prolixibacter bellariivorans TaxID=314319 RepID=A0A5M4AW87_9BACT|nr:type I restriction enzyme HsdR N-terminal domain-containing protein [Prolixibacter bellariivorans]GET32189.1 hypothetical protein PbJCM13498_10520 [Prolixibacter bellariivorans]
MNLNLPKYNLRVRLTDGKKSVFDPCRKKWVPLTPEERVRQLFIRYLNEEKQYPLSLIAVEMSLRINRNAFRSDLVIFSSQGTPLLAVECKAPKVKITQETFDQIARYNMQLKVKYLVVTNGIQHYCCRFSTEANSYEFLPIIPDYQSL